MNATPPTPADVAKGLAGVVAGSTAICSLAGTLRYRGYDIEPLARAGDFEEVAFLLLHGDLPSRSDLAAFRDRVAAAARSLPTAAVEALARLAAERPDASPMDALRTGVSVLGLLERDDAPGDRPAWCVRLPERTELRDPSRIPDAASNRGRRGRHVDRAGDRGGRTDGSGGGGLFRGDQRRPARCGGMHRCGGCLSSRGRGRRWRVGGDSGTGPGRRPCRAPGLTRTP